MDHTWHQNDQYWSFFVEQKSNFSLISDTLSVGDCWGQPMLLFWNLVNETKWANLLNPLGNIVQDFFWFFYPSEPFTLDHFFMRPPVTWWLSFTVHKVLWASCYNHPWTLLKQFFKTDFLHLFSGTCDVSIRWRRWTDIYTSLVSLICIYLFELDPLLFP